MLDLRDERNRLASKAAAKQARFDALVASVRQEGLSKPARQMTTPAYLQHQLWLVEQAWNAEKK
eukprot:SAG25_NODE_337_length_9543_cov_4.171961_11_plen_64_part_00